MSLYASIVIREGLLGLNSPLSLSTKGFIPIQRDMASTGVYDPFSLMFGGCSGWFIEMFLRTIMVGSCLGRFLPVFM